MQTIGMAGAALLGAGVALDLLSQRTLWGNAATHITSADQDDEALDQRRWIALPGLGRQSGKFISEQARGFIPGIIDYANYASRGISSKAIGTALAAYYARHYGAGGNMRQNVLVHSMGLPTFLMGVEWCLTQGIDVPVVDTLLAFSSPLHAKHTFMEDRVRLVKRIPYPGGAISKFGVEFFQRHEREKFRLSALGHSILGALRVAYRDCPPALWSSQVRTIAHTDQYNPTQFSGVITPNTRIFHFGDEADQTVNVVSAREGIADLATSLGASISLIDVPGDGHANIAGPKTRQYLGSLFAEH